LLIGHVIAPFNDKSAPASRKYMTICFLLISSAKEMVSFDYVTCITSTMNLGWCALTPVQVDVRSEFRWSFCCNRRTRSAMLDRSE
jgi:hypothetical protein